MTTFNVEGDMKNNFGVYDSGKKVGSFVIEPDKTSLTLLAVEIFKPYRKKGYGKEVLRFIEDLARSKGKKMVYAHDVNEKAIGFYMRNGYDFEDSNYGTRMSKRIRM